MTDIRDLVLEHLKKIQTQLSASRERDREILGRLGNLETMMARVGRHAVGVLRTRIESNQRRLELDA
jgi:hypothetical protein